MIIGVDFHPEFQQIASVDTDSGEFQEKRLAHPAEAEQFYRDLAGQGKKVRVGMETSGHARWFERLLAELQLELWIANDGQFGISRIPKSRKNPALRLRYPALSRSFNSLTTRANSVTSGSSERRCVNTLTSSP